MTNARTWSCPSRGWKKSLCYTLFLCIFFHSSNRLEKIWQTKAFTFAWVKAVVAHGGSTSQMKGSIEAGTESAWSKMDVKRIQRAKIFNFQILWFLYQKLIFVLLCMILYLYFCNEYLRFIIHTTTMRPNGFSGWTDQNLPRKPFGERSKRGKTRQDNLTLLTSRLFWQNMSLFGIGVGDCWTKCWYPKSRN